MRLIRFAKGSMEETGRVRESRMVIRRLILPGGTSREGALRRLRKDRPDLPEMVLKGEKGAHASCHGPIPCH
jgi:hypothetical protein